MEGFGARLRELFGRKEKAELEHPSPPAPSNTGGAESFADANNDFALAMYRQLRNRPGNLFFSPFSIRTALGMTEAGARGDTAAQMQEVLHLSSSDATGQVAFAELLRRLNAAGGGKYEMAVANSLWGQNDAPLEPGFLDRISRDYAGSVNLVDFRRAAEQVRATINQWVEETTRQKIRDLIPSGSLNALTRLVLVNAVYFKGTWVLPFERQITHDEPFHLEGGGMVQVPLMHQQTVFQYGRSAGYQAIDMAYRGGDLSLLVILPDREDGIGDLEKTLSARMLRDCAAQMSPREIKLYLPRFKLTWGTVNVGEPLLALGMQLAFDAHADFSGINGHKPPSAESLFLSAVFHKSFVEVNEEGTEAAAATAVAVETLCAKAPSKPPPIPTFRADHPFLFAIRDRKTGAILFLGRMVDPTREG